jgi:ketosteroid isomerase-like protein
MKTSLIISVIIAGLAVLATLSLAADAESELKAVEQRWSDAYTKGDTATLKTVEAEDYSMVNADGTISTKAEDIKGVADKTFVVKSATMSDMKIRTLGNSHACVTGMWTLTEASEKGKDISGDYRFIDIFERKNNKWQAIATQLTKIEKK